MKDEAINTDREKLQNSFLFKGIKVKEKTVESFCAKEYEKGEKTGSEAEKKVGIITSGSFTVHPKGNKKTVLKKLKEGDAFGVSSLFTKEDTAVSDMEAEKKSRVLYIGEKELLTLFKEEPKTAINYIAFLSEKIRFLNGKIELFSSLSTEDKVLNYLKKHADENGETQSKNMSLLSRELGLGRTSLYRALETLKEKGIIENKNGKIKVIK